MKSLLRGGTTTKQRKERGTIGNEELQALLDEDNIQTQQELAEALNVDQSVVGRRLHGMGMFQKLENWISHESTERQMECRKMTYPKTIRKEFSTSACDWR
ncbi:hypothetical protein Trydic_g21223 [Trypoxylus dichotomus]